MLNLFLGYTFSPLPFLLGNLFLLCSLLPGLGTICSFSVKIISVWQGGLTKGLITQDSVSSGLCLGGFVLNDHRVYI